MLTPSYLAGLPDDIVKLYSQLEADIACDMARRISRLGNVTGATVGRMELYAELGGLQKTINETVTKYNAQVKKLLIALYKDAATKSAQHDLAQYNKAVLTDSQKQILDATVSKLADGKIAQGSATAKILDGKFAKDYDGMVRITQTIASNAEHRFVEECNSAYLKVSTGAYDYKTAIKESVNNLASTDNTVVAYGYKTGTRSMSVEAAVRMNVMTGINQTCAEITERNADGLSCDLVEVDAHEGARPEHAEWQGKIYSRSGTSDKYPPFSVCGLGDVTGICGVNCRHSYYPYFEGMDKHNTQDELNNMNEKNIDYDGVKMTKYEAEQKQRAMERKIRQWKRTADIQQAGGVDNTAARIRLGDWQATAQDFTDKTGLRRDYSREYIGTKSGKQPTGL